MTPTQRTLAKLKAIGFQAAVVEKWNQHARIRQDVWGFGDILACRPGFGTMLVQCTSGSNHAARRAKILTEPRAAQWLACGNQIEVWSWDKRGARGKRKMWALRRESITVGDMRYSGYR